MARPVLPQELNEFCLHAKGYDTLGFFPLRNPLIFLSTELLEETRLTQVIVLFGRTNSSRKAGRKLGRIKGRRHGDGRARPHPVSTISRTSLRPLTKVKKNSMLRIVTSTEWTTSLRADHKVKDRLCTGQSDGGSVRHDFGIRI